MRDAETLPPSLTAVGATVAVDEEVLLRPTSLSVAAGEIVALRGANGTGKTTLLRAFAGLIPLSGGELLVQGEVPEPRSQRFRVALAALIWTPPLARDLTLAEHLELVALTWEEAAAEAPDKAVGMLERLGLGGLLRRFPHELSSGQQQLFALSLTMIRPSSVLVLDEPEQRLDADRRGVLAALLRDRAAAGTAVLMATHSTELVAGSHARTVHLGAPGQ